MTWHPLMRFIPQLTSGRAIVQNPHKFRHGLAQCSIKNIEEHNIQTAHWHELVSSNFYNDSMSVHKEVASAAFHQSACSHTFRQRVHTRWFSGIPKIYFLSRVFITITLLNGMLVTSDIHYDSPYRWFDLGQRQILNKFQNMRKLCCAL